MSTRKSVWLATLLWVFCSSVYADAGWTEKGQIQALSTTSFSRIVVLASFPDNVSDCRDKQRFYIDFGRPGSGFIHDLLLAALTSGKSIQLRVTGKCELKGMSEFSQASILAN